MNLVPAGFSSINFQKIMKWAFYACFIVLHIFILRNVYLMGRDLLLGDNSANMVVPQPRYLFMRIPQNRITVRYDAINRLAGDFAQIYFPSQRMDLLSRNYEDGNLDPWERPSKYPALFHYVCSITICKLSYGPASIMLVGLQYLLFLVIYIAAFCLLDIKRHILAGVLFANICIFLTPTGLSWFERGQFSLFVGSAYLVLMLGLIKRNNWLILLSAVLAFIKWTSFPFVLIALSVYLFNSKNLSEIRQKILVAAAYGLIIIAMTIAIPQTVLPFLNALLVQEGTVPDGIGLAAITSHTFAKSTPFVLIGLAALLSKMNKGVFEQSIPFLAGSAILFLTFSSQAYEYNLPSVLGFIPFLLYWVKQDNPSMRIFERKIMLYIFPGFVLLASFSNLVMRADGVIYEYLFASFVLLFFPFYDSWRFGRDARLRQNGAVS